MILQNYTIIITTVNKNIYFKIKPQLEKQIGTFLLNQKQILICFNLEGTCIWQKTANG